MDYFLNEDQKAIRDLARKIAQDRVIPVRAELDEKEEFPWGPLKYLADVGLFGVYIPEAYGGLGFGSFENCLAIEEISRASGSIGLS
ncbi:MAG: acyl-CoA dehydrogenase family protein, partial [Thermodesulfobacteriota bacterium]